MSGRDLLSNERRLFEELCTTVWLDAGFRRLKQNKGSPGTDGVTIAEFESRLDEELSRLKAELESWTYKPSPVRRVECFLPGDSTPICQPATALARSALRQVV